MEELKQFLDERKKYLKKIEWDYFNKAHDKSIPEHERKLYREFSNIFEGRRQELEYLESQNFYKNFSNEKTTE